MKRKIKFTRKLSLLMSSCAIASAMVPFTAAAVGGNENYAGFSMSMLTQANVTPFRDTTQDLDALLIDNGLASYQSLSANESNLAAVTIPYIVKIDSSATQIEGATLSVQALATSMGLSDYAAITKQATIDYAVTSASQASTSALLWGTAADSQANTTGLTMSSDGRTLTIDAGGLPEFNVQSIINPKTYSATNSQKYLAMVSGASVPMSGMMLPTDFSGDDSVQNYNNYNLSVAREAAIQSAAVAALEEIAAGNVPLTQTTAASLGQHFVNTGLIPTQNNISNFMASRRMDPANGWYYRIQQASPIELQRESLYLQAETLYETNKARQQAQKDTLLLALLLMEQSRMSVGMINMQMKMTAVQSSSGSSTTTADTSTEVPMDTTTTASS